MNTLFGTSVREHSVVVTAVHKYCVVAAPVSINTRGGHSIFFSLFAIDGSITFSLLIDFDKSTFLGIFMFASSINRCFWQVTKNQSLSKFANR
jgi:hypothetical protein